MVNCCLSAIFQFLLVLKLIHLPFTTCTSIINLNGDSWTIISAGNPSTSLSGRVPGSIFTDLFRHGMIEDPLFRFNDLNYRNVSMMNWNYSREFQVESSFLTHDNVLLRADGIDTVASITINGIKLGNTDNMFRMYTFDAKSALKQGTNTITISFEAPVNYAKKKAAAYPYDVPPDCPPPEQKGECHGNFIRKEACSFSWDWGPAFPTIGIWKDIMIEAFNGPIMRYVVPETRLIDDVWQLDIKIHFDKISAESSGIAHVSSPYLSIETKQEIVVKESVLLTYDLKNVDISPWWPNGHGNPHLYGVNVTFINSHGHEGITHSLKVGFRTIKLIQNPIIGASGLTFHFEVNGQPIFIKGSNWIPADSFQERITKDYLRDLLKSAADANMNMLRVWGGGVYESDDFYDLADELGILLWQDFMFACSDYPADEDFLVNVKEEIRHQMRRIMKHPSIAIWAGNNENEWGFMAKRHTPTDPHKLQYYKDYIALTVETIFAVVQEEDAYSRPFVASSPSNGAETVTEGWVARNPQDTHYGDVHHYDYNSDSWNPDVFPIPRFASEYGFQSWCSLDTLRSVANLDDLRINSSFCNHRQHHPKGQGQMWNEVAMHLKLPNSQNETQKFIDFIYLTQINQAISIKTETELFRRMQGHLTSEGEGMTMGSLYWQLNDIWQAPTWASIEYGGKWKMLQYFARHFYSHSLISPAISNNHLEVYFIHEIPASEKSKQKRDDWQDSLFTHHDSRNNENEVIHMKRDENGWNVEVSVYDWSNTSPLKTWNMQIVKIIQTSNLIFQLEVAQILSQSSCASQQHCFIHVSAVSADKSVSIDNWVPLSNFTDAVGLKKPQMKISTLASTERGFSFELTSDSIAPFTWLEAGGIRGEFSTNGFLTGIKSCAPKKIEFYAKEKVSIDMFQKHLTVKSLMDIYV